MKKLLLIIYLILLGTNLAYAWEIRKSKNRMDDTSTYIVSSPHVSPENKLNFPYENVVSEIYYGLSCKFSGSRYRDYSEGGFGLAFNKLNLTGKYIRARFDDNPAMDIPVSNKSGSDIIHLNTFYDFKKMVMKSNYLLVQIPWYGQRSAYFKYNLSGSAKAISEAESDCQIELNNMKGRQ